MLTLDNHDPRIRYVHLQPERTLPLNLPEPPLPAGYRFAFCRPGDRDAWIGIEQSSRGFDDYGAGLAKPLIARTLGVMHALGYPRATIPTQTITWPAASASISVPCPPHRASRKPATAGASSAR